MARLPTALLLAACIGLLPSAAPAQTKNRKGRGPAPPPMAPVTVGGPGLAAVPSLSQVTLWSLDQATSPMDICTTLVNGPADVRLVVDDGATAPTFPLRPGRAFSVCLEGTLRVDVVCESASQDCVVAWRVDNPQR